MYRFHRSPLFLFVVILALSALACQALSIDPSATTPPAPSQQELVDQAVATVMAQIPQASALPPVTASQSAPLSTDIENSLIELYKRVNPAVVHIYVIDEQSFVLGTGSGFVYDELGHIVTNNHVVTGASGLEVVFPDGTRRSAEVVGTDVDSDLAVIKVDGLPAGVLPIPLGDSDNAQVGQFVVAIGNPFDEAGSLSLGIISGLGRSLSSDRIAEGGGRYSLPQVIQTDAAINPGNSGGPLINMSGEVIGVNTAIESPVRANSGVGFAVPANVVNVVITQLRESGEVRYPWLGIAGGTLTPDAAEELGLPRETRGVLVSEVTVGGPAEAAGLRGLDPTTNTGADIITGIDNLTVVEFDDLLGYIVQQTRIGQQVTLTILRDGQQQTLSLTLGERPAAPPQTQQQTTPTLPQP